MGEPVWGVVVGRGVAALVCLYLSVTWARAAKETTGRSQSIWIAMAWFFRVTAVCGFVAPALAPWIPGAALWIEGVGLLLVAVLAARIAQMARGHVLAAQRHEILFAAVLRKNGLGEGHLEDLERLDEAKKMIARLGRPGMASRSQKEK